MQRMPSSHGDPHAHVIHVPGRRLLHKVPLSYVWNKVSGHGRKSSNASLNLVSLIDFLVVTVVFLLMSFSASGQCEARAAKVPGAVNVEAMVDAPLVSVHQGQILVDGVAAGSTSSIDEVGRVEKIGPLFEILKSKRELYRQLQPNKDFPGVCVLAIDESTNAVVVKSVFQTAAFAGYANVSFLVKALPK